MSRQLEARITKIPGTERHMPARQYGQPVDMAKIRSNLTLTSLIAPDSAELAYFCGIDPAIKHRQDEEKAAKAMRAESLRMQTEQLAARNAAARQQREQLAPWQRGYQA